MSNCVMCESEFESLDEKQATCSTECRQSNEMMIEGSRILESTMPSEDSRIFFYPMSFGTLCDLYSVMSIRRANTRSIRNQQEMDYKITRVKKNIVDLLEQLFHETTQRSNMAVLLEKLFKVNAEGWTLKDVAMNKRYDEETRADAALRAIEKIEERTALIQQLDILHAGRTHTYRVLNGKEI
jgi:hypothetical protein